MSDNDDHYRELFLRAERERDKFKGWLFDAWSNHRGQTRGMQRMARRIKRLRLDYDALKHQWTDREQFLMQEHAASLLRNQPLVDRVQALEALITAHNEGCRASCGRSNAHNASLKGCEAYISRGMQCPDCSEDWLIELPQSSGEGVKND